MITAVLSLDSQSPRPKERSHTTVGRSWWIIFSRTSYGIAVEDTPQSQPQSQSLSLTLSSGGHDCLAVPLYSMFAVYSVRGALVSPIRTSKHCRGVSVSYLGGWYGEIVPSLTAIPSRPLTTLFVNIQQLVNISQSARVRPAFCCVCLNRWTWNGMSRLIDSSIGSRPCQLILDFGVIGWLENDGFATAGAPLCHVHVLE